MNSALKPLVDEVFDVETGVEDGIKRSWTQLATDGLKAVMDAPALVQNFSGIKADAVALVSDPAAASDLVAYIGGKLSSKSPELQTLVTASIDGGLTVAIKVSKIIGAVKAYQASLAAPAAAAAPVQS